MDATAVFEAERPRLLRIASRVLSDPAEAEDVVQTAWIRLDGTHATIENLPGWLTTVTTRLCLDRLRKRTPEPTEQLQPDDDHDEHPTDPAEEIALADTVGVALQIVLERLTPGERVAFVLHDSFAIEFPTIATILDTTPAAARKLASRARAKVAQPATEGHTADWAVVDAFLSAAREGDFSQLMALLAPDAVAVGDIAAVALGTPARIEGGRRLAEMFNGGARAARAVLIGDRPGAAWMHRGTARVAFDFTIQDGRIRRIDFRADPDVLRTVTARANGRAARMPDPSPGD